jgi:hypothetical protein
MNIEATFFGPLAKDYCSLFLFLSVVGLIYIILAILALFALILSRKGTGKDFFGLVSLTAMGIVIYIQNRLFYNICLR